MLEYLAGEGGLALLDINPGLVIWTSITFLVVFLVLRFLAWKPIAESLDARADKIHADLDRAEEIRKDAETKLDDYMGKLNGLKQEGQDIIAEARKDAEELKKSIMEDAKKEADAIKARGLRDIQLAMDKALESYHKNLTDMSIAIAGQILGKAISAKEHERLISEAVSKVKSLN
jgi:F-type H+-transporting ATPase subunit b